MTVARQHLAGLDSLPVDDRPSVFEAVHAALASELAALDEV